MSGEITLYRERAWLLDGYVHLFGGVISYNDPVCPDWPVLYIETPEGQMSWHIAPEDLAEFGKMTVIPDYPWDRHTTKEKYLRLRRLVARLPNLTSANPRYGEQ
jgi:hypothetical protein